MDREHWLRAARRALLAGGPAAVRVERLARTLKVTKGSFYWHFRDRPALLEALIAEWEQETEALFSEAERMVSPAAALRHVMDYSIRAVAVSHAGRSPSDAALFAWALVDRTIARRVERVERRRLDFAVRMSDRPERAHLVYLAWVGFVSRRLRSPHLADEFPLLAQTFIDFLLPRKDT